VFCIDRHSGRRVLIGGYHPSYASGPIAYGVLLYEALATSSLSLPLEGASGLGSADLERTDMARDLDLLQRDLQWTRP